MKYGTKVLAPNPSKFDEAQAPANHMRWLTVFLKLSVTMMRRQRKFLYIVLKGLYKAYICIKDIQSTNYQINY